MVIRPGVELRLSDVELRTSRSSGPGGQHANVTASRVEAVLDVAASLPAGGQQAPVLARLGPRVTATAQDTRSQARNRELALERLRDRLDGALHVRRARRPTRPTPRRGAAAPGAEAAHLRAQARAPAPGRGRGLSDVVAARPDSGWPSSWCSPSRAGAGSTCWATTPASNRADLDGPRDARRRRRHGEGAARRRARHEDRALHRRRHARDASSRTNRCSASASRRARSTSGSSRAGACAWRSGASAATATAACSPTSTCAGTATRS